MTWGVVEVPKNRVTVFFGSLFHVFFKTLLAFVFLGLMIHKVVDDCIGFLFLHLQTFRPREHLFRFFLPMAAGAILEFQCSILSMHILMHTKIHH